MVYFAKAVGILNVLLCMYLYAVIVYHQDKFYGLWPRGGSNKVLWLTAACHLVRFVQKIIDLDIMRETEKINYIQRFLKALKLFGES